ncbi:HAL protein kinase [Fusarium keratoplasticum]|uniref:HAL protein kinase n=1 Tax=Fusarium keratoplasticum TaxID=1328300 RepID=A0ACC0R8J6_9HYPO|nr:HAL protein kinase [Fusarium keratoplasticum]KAI8676057.1 HAL protein kinase [Fusarium keratoplasticum]
MPWLVSNQANSNKQETAQLTSEREGRRDSSATLVEKYGKCREVVGRGKFGIVLVSLKKKENGVGEELYAVKKFQRQPKETERIYGNYCEIMEFCTGGDLHSLLMRGVEYIHEMGVAHLDLKPKNLLLTYDGLLKISDFGHSECVRFAWEKDVHRVSGIPNPDPYVAPEEYTGGGFDGYAVDIWACGVIYMSMITGRCLWRTAKTSEDASYSQYLEARRHQEGFEPIESLPRLFSGLEIGGAAIDLCQR